MPRTFEDKPAVRSQVPLLVGLMGPSGGGKTLSALRLATGIQRVTGGDIFLIDTEARRAAAYSDDFKFRHIDFGAPFGSLDYLAALRHCVGRGAGVTIVDSMTHEHTGPGGYLMLQEEEMQRMAGNDYSKREKVKFAAWIKPANHRQQLINGVLQLKSNFIFCFRAKEKIKPVRGGEPLHLGFMPIAGEEMIFEMSVNCLLMPRANGVPTWRSDNIGEKLMMKLPRHFEHLFKDGKPLDEEIGAGLAEWARGSAVPAPQQQPAREPDRSPDNPPLAQEGAMAAERGMETYRTFWTRLTSAQKKSVGGEAQHLRWKQVAEEADRMAGIEQRELA